MPAKASPVRVPTPGAFLGKFHIRRFNVSQDDDRLEYERIRTLGNKSDAGLTIENIRDLTETTEITDSEGNRVRQDRWYIVVSWWEKDTGKPANPPEPERGFYLERPARLVEGGES